MAARLGTARHAINRALGLRSYATEELANAVNRALLVDTLALARSFEEAGLERRPAELLAKHITELIVSTKLKLEECFVDKTQASKVIVAPHGSTRCMRAAALLLLPA